MKNVLKGIIVAVVLSISISSAYGGESGINKLNDAIGDLKTMVSIPEKAIPPILLRNASGIAIIPGVLKAGFVIGGRYGSGILVLRKKDGTWSDPSFVTLTGGSIGWQIGVESIDIILVFKNEGSINKLMSGKFTIGVDASAAVGPIGREAQASTDVQLKSEIYSYSRSRGLFAGLTLSGAALQIDDDMNENFYKKENIRAKEIFGNNLAVPPEVGELKKLLSEYATK